MAMQNNQMVMVFNGIWWYCLGIKNGIYPEIYVTLLKWITWCSTTTVGFLVIKQVPCRHRCECQRHDCGLGPWGPWIQQVVLMDFNGKLIEDIEVPSGKLT